MPTLTRMEYLTIQRAKRIADGVCRDCGKQPPSDGRVMCFDCYKKRSERNQAHRFNRMSVRQCTQCQNEAKGTSTICDVCTEATRLRGRLRRKANKEFVYAAFGSCCNECAETDIRVMTIDHINNDGRIDAVTISGKRADTTTLYVKLVAAIKANMLDRKRYAMLCFNCHAKKDNSPWWIT